MNKPYLPEDFICELWYLSKQCFFTPNESSLNLDKLSFNLKNIYKISDLTSLYCVCKILQQHDIFYKFEKIQHIHLMRNKHNKNQQYLLLVFMNGRVTLLSHKLKEQQLQTNECLETDNEHNNINFYDHIKSIYPNILQ